MSAAGQQRDRLSVAIAAVTCGRLTQAAEVRATRGFCTARADQYGVRVTETPQPAAGDARRGRRPAGGAEVVLEHWGGDAEMLTTDFRLRSPARIAEPAERARVAARTIRDYALDSLDITYADGTELSADEIELILRGPREGRLRRRDLLLRSPLDELV